MDTILYYKVILHNNINNNTIKYNRNITNCITLLKIIERYDGKQSCNNRILKYINKRFQCKYKINDTNSIIINYNNEELYSDTINKLSIDKEYANNIKINIYEELLKDKRNKIFKRTNNINKVKSYNNNSKSKSNKFKYMKTKEFKDFNKFVNNINSIKNGLIKINSKFKYKNELDDEPNDISVSINDILEINILTDDNISK